jgi:uncharacterized protein
MLRLILALCALFLLAVAPPAAAEPYPAPASLYVNDYADLLGPEAEDRVQDALRRLRDETGIEATLLTLATRSDYDYSATLERFATGLFNTWGIGDATRHDSILILVIRDDREMRIELGSGYGRDFDWIAQQIIDTEFLPAFRDGRYEQGIEAGTAATLARIAYPHAQELPPEAPGLSERLGELKPVLVPVVIIGAMLLLVFRRRLADLSQGLRRCPNCGRFGLRRHSETERDATLSAPGLGHRITECRYCDYRDSENFTIAPRRRNTGSGGNFGGGGSSGGGASGRW